MYMYVCVYIYIYIYIHTHNRRAPRAHVGWRGSSTPYATLIRVRHPPHQVGIGLAKAVAHSSRTHSAPTHCFGTHSSLLS